MMSIATGKITIVAIVAHGIIFQLMKSGQETCHPAGRTKIKKPALFSGFEGLAKRQNKKPPAGFLRQGVLHYPDYSSKAMRQVPVLGPAGIQG
jgi:hypothetical protein